MGRRVSITLALALLIATAASQPLYPARKVLEPRIYLAERTQALRKLQSGEGLEGSAPIPAPVPRPAPALAPTPAPTSAQAPTPAPVASPTPMPSGPPPVPAPGTPIYTPPPDISPAELPPPPPPPQSSQPSKSGDNEENSNAVVALWAVFTSFIFLTVMGSVLAYYFRTQRLRNQITRDKVYLRRNVQLAAQDGADF